MKMGKAKLKRILSDETGIPIGDITIHGKYDYHGNKEQLKIGDYTITATNGKVYLYAPVTRDTDEEIRYKNTEIKVAPINEAATSGRSTNNTQ